MIDINLSRKSNGVGSHDQIIHFVGGIKRLIQGVQYVWEQEMVHIVDYLGVEYVVNKQNVLFFERVSYSGKGGGDESDKQEDARISKKCRASTGQKAGRGHGQRTGKDGKRKTTRPKNPERRTKATGKPEKSYRGKRTKDD